MKPRPLPQPKPVKLPSTMPDGKTTKLHPLLWCLKNRMPEGANKSTLAARMAVRPQSVYKWEARAREDRHFPVPLMRAAQMAEFFNVPLALFRPDMPKGGQ